MTLRQIRFTLQLSLAGLVCAMGLTLGIALVLPCQVRGTADLPRVPAGNEQVRSERSHAVPTLAELKVVSGKRLRDPRFPPAASPAKPAAATPAKPPVALQVKLLGTMLEADGAYAIFSTGRPGVQVRKVGQRVGDPEHGPQLLHVDVQEVVVRQGGQEITLSVEGRKMN